MSSEENDLEYMQSDIYLDQVQRIKELETKLAICIEALKFYEDCLENEDQELFVDSGQRAREALKKVEER